MTTKGDRLWGGGYTEATHPLVQRMNASVTYDQAMAREDILGSVAHATMLRDQHILRPEEHTAIVRGLRTILDEIETGHFDWQIEREDVHMNVEAALRDRIGALAGRLHTARSRNDQCALDERLWLRRKLAEIGVVLARLLEVLAQSALAHADVPMPGYTHLQRAQPVTLGHHLLAHAEAMARDAERLLDVQKRVDVCPLGSGALAGTTLPIDRHKVAELLNFSRISANSLDAVGDRDHLVEAMAAAALGSVHLSRIGEELVLFTSAEFAFVRLPDAFTTGSSLMPQKKNPDMAELVRGKSGRVIGDLVTLLIVLKGLPLAYNKDMQEDKEPLFDSLSTWHDCLNATADMLERAQWQPQNLLKALDKGFLLATDLADALVAMGMPFREAHERIAELVAELTNKQLTFDECGHAEIARLLGLKPQVVAETLDVQKALMRRDIPGAPHPDRVRQAAQEMLQRAHDLRQKAAAGNRRMAAEDILADVEDKLPDLQG